MKGGAIFRARLTEDDIRAAVGMNPPHLQRKDNVHAVYRSPRRILVIQESDKYNNPGGGEGEMGNVHAMLVTLPETTGTPKVELFPDIAKNFFKQNIGSGYSLVDRVNNELKYNVAIAGVPAVTEREGVTSQTRGRQIAVAQAATKELPEVVQQRIASMAGLTNIPKGQRPLTVESGVASEAVPLSDVSSALAKEGAAEAKADAIIDAAVVWVKAWNAEHVAGKGQKKAATAARRAASKALEDLEEGRTKVSIPMPASSSSSSSSSAAPGPAAAGAPQGGRKKTRRSLRTKRTTRRR